MLACNNETQKKFLQIFFDAKRFAEIRPILIEIIYESAKCTNDLARFKGRQDVIDFIDELITEKN